MIDALLFFFFFFLYDFCVFLLAFLNDTLKVFGLEIFFFFFLTLFWLSFLMKVVTFRNKEGNRKILMEIGQAVVAIRVPTGPA